jgi:hypothetical protein
MWRGPVGLCDLGEHRCEQSVEDDLPVEVDDESYTLL